MFRGMSYSGFYWKIRCRVRRHQAMKANTLIMRFDFNSMLHKDVNDIVSEMAISQLQLI